MGGEATFNVVQPPSTPAALHKLEGPHLTERSRHVKGPSTPNPRVGIPQKWRNANRRQSSDLESVRSLREASNPLRLLPTFQPGV
eukprot:180525-Chlamydomonas_euryale.AAC.13